MLAGHDVSLSHSKQRSERVILVHILTSEAMELRTTDEREYCDMEVRNTNIGLYRTTIWISDSALIS